MKLLEETTNVILAILCFILRQAILICDIRQQSTTVGNTPDVLRMLRFQAEFADECWRNVRTSYLISLIVGTHPMKLTKYFGACSAAVVAEELYREKPSQYDVVMRCRILLIRTSPLESKQFGKEFIHLSHTVNPLACFVLGRTLGCRDTSQNSPDFQNYASTYSFLRSTPLIYN